MGFFNACNCNVSLILDNGSQRMAVAFDVCKECLGRSEIQIHVQAHRQMVQVVGDIERNDFLLFVVYIFHQ